MMIDPPSIPCDVTAEIAHYIATAQNQELPNEVIFKTKCHLVDTMAAMVSGSQLKAGRVATAFVVAQGGIPESTVVGTDLVTSAIQAAFTNGMFAHADETDDSHLGGRFHPGCAIVPAALAIAEREKRNGMELLRAIALGYDIGARFTRALGYTSPRSGTHSTHSLGAVFGAAAASLFHFSSRQVASLLSFAVQQASGIPYWERDADHIEKAFDFGGMGARNGVSAALMVVYGFSGIADPLIGKHSYLAAFAENPKPDELVADLGKRFEIMEASIKKWCVGSPIQAALDAIMALIDEHNLMPADVDILTAHMPHDRLVLVDNRDMPDVCLQHLLAVALVDRGLTFASSHDLARMEDPEVLKIRQRISVMPSQELTLAKPARQAIIEIQTRDGQHLHHRTRAVLGTPENPMSKAEITTKALDLLMPILGIEGVHTLVETLWLIENLDSVESLRNLVQSQ